MAETFTNRLAKESSPYLLQHAHNPVDWYPWGDEALERAKAEDKLILVSIGYAACHWCHVMERESFEDEQTAALMNKNYINIKIDREERPDLDMIYMDVVQALTGSGGWPLNVILTPDGKPFYGGTYFPPKPHYRLPSWTQLLNNIHGSFIEKRSEIEEQADRVLQYLKQSDKAFLEQQKITDDDSFFKPTSLISAFENLKNAFDTDSGGFGSAPKFPHAMDLLFLLRYHHFSKDERALNHVEFSLEQMINGGIYDQIGGGFARYTTDSEWLVPHFEKMLYDNALLLRLMAETYMVTRKDIYKKAIQETIIFLESEMKSANSGFYSSLDADSEGEEGKFYVWTKGEIEDVLGGEAEAFIKYYEITENGNWEGKNILNRNFSGAPGISISDEQLDRNKQQLLQHRNKRTRPGLDDKEILGWNALVCSAYTYAWRALGEEKYKAGAADLAIYLLENFKSGNENSNFPMLHVIHRGKGKQHAFLDDYALLASALVETYEITYRMEFLERAEEILSYVIGNFGDDDEMFYYSDKNQDEILVRKKEFYDNATPSGNSTMAGVLRKMSLITGNASWGERAFGMLKKLRETIIQHPSSFGNWLSEYMFFQLPLEEIAVVGESSGAKGDEIVKFYLPGTVLMVSNNNFEKYPLLTDRRRKNQTLIYICREYSCKTPIESLKEFSQYYNSAAYGLAGN